MGHVFVVGNCCRSSSAGNVELQEVVAVLITAVQDVGVVVVVIALVLIANYRSDRRETDNDGRGKRQGGTTMIPNQHKNVESSTVPYSREGFPFTQPFGKRSIPMPAEDRRFDYFDWRKNFG